MALISQNIIDIKPSLLEKRGCLMGQPLFFDLDDFKIKSRYLNPLL